VGGSLAVRDIQPQILFSALDRRRRRRHKSVALICSRYYIYIYTYSPVRSFTSPTRTRLSALRPMHPSDGSLFERNDSVVGIAVQIGSSAPGPAPLPGCQSACHRQSGLESTLDFSTLPRSVCG
jgi:hypothetical protein